MIITDSFFIDLVALVAGALVTLIIYGKWKYKYWERMGLEYPQPTFGLGNLVDTALQRKAVGDEIEQFYFQFKPKGLKHAGLFFLHLPVYMPIDPEIIKRILQVDFSYFADRGVYYNEKDDPLSAHLFSLEGAKWRNLRAKLSPTFTSGKMKMMFPIVVKTSEELIGVLDSYTAHEPVEIKDILARLTTDIIGTCAFGLDCNSLRDPNTEFRKKGKKFFENQGKQRFVQLFGFLHPNMMRFFGAKLIEEGLAKFFMGIVKDTIQYREANAVNRNDFMQLLIQLKNQEESSDNSSKASSRFTVEELAAQALLFFLAGFETSSTTMSYCLYELALNEDIQEKVRAEIEAVLAKHNGEFSYEAMMEMDYMETVINETLRKHPPVSLINRICLKDYKVPGTNVVIEKGIRVFVPVQGIHHDPEYYPNPKAFDPNRFNEDNKRKIHPFTYLPFGEGPRICLGLRFGVMQTKVGLTVLLKNYKFRLDPRTPIPLRSDPTSILNSAEGGIWINITKIVEKTK